MAAQSPKFSLYNAGLQEKIFTVNEDHPSPQRPMSARSRMSTKSAPGSKRPGSASFRGRGSNLKPQGKNQTSGRVMQPVPPGQSQRGKTVKESTAVDMRPYMVLGREELLGQLINAKKKQVQNDNIINQLKAENQR